MNRCGTARPTKISVAILIFFFAGVKSSSDDIIFEMFFETTTEDCSRKLLRIFLECCEIGGERWKSRASKSYLVFSRTHGATSYSSFDL